MPATTDKKPEARAVRRAVNAASDELAAAHERIAELEESLKQAQSRLADFENREQEATRKRHDEMIEAAVNDGRLKKEDTASQDFWRQSLGQNEEAAVAAMEALPKGAVLAKVTSGTDTPAGQLDVATRQERALAEIREKHPNLDFKAVFAKARHEHPSLFR
ncbi:MAG: hypothetical protein JJU00_18875 [Opitutales bacterium]|nr:hypothetical protein [Opitutales bacterium]